jgi:hypothetical protein
MFIIVLFIGYAIACTTDADCRDATNCNAICNTLGVCMHHPTKPIAVCNATYNICYQSVGDCYPACTQSSDCASIPTVLHYPNAGVCDSTSGKCYDCLTTADCIPSRNESCNAVCLYNAATLEYLCGNGNVCLSNQACLPVAATQYACVNSASAITAASALMLTLFVVFF